MFLVDARLLKQLVVYKSHYLKIPEQAALEYTVQCLLSPHSVTVSYFKVFLTIPPPSPHIFF